MQRRNANGRTDGRQLLPKNSPGNRQEEQSPSVSVIGFLDVDSFECQLWQRDVPMTRGIPCVVSNTSGRIMAVSQEAKLLGISRKLTPTLKEVKKIVPKIHVFTKKNKWGKQDQSLVRKGSYEVVAAIQNYLKIKDYAADVKMEVSSSDEIYLDLTTVVNRRLDKLANFIREQNRFSNNHPHPSLKMPEDVIWERHGGSKKGPFEYYHPLHRTANVEMWIWNLKKIDEKLIIGGRIMSELCNHVLQQTGLVSSGGVGQSKRLAKVGCTLNKPRKVTILPNSAMLRVGQLLGISVIPGLGGMMGATLSEKFKIHNLNDLRSMKYQEIKEEFGEEKAKMLWSWGMDITRELSPVIQKISSDEKRINKPSSQSITNIKQLENTLKNLGEEAHILLKEERERYCRTAKEIRVNLTYQFDQAKEEGSTWGKIYEIKNENSLHQLVPIILKDLKTEAPKINDKEKFKITGLSIVILNFCDSESKTNVTQLSQDMKKLTVSEAPTELKIKMSGIAVKVPVFHHQEVGTFRINSNMEYTLKNAILPKLLPEQELKDLVGYNLFDKFPGNAASVKLIKDYATYDMRKHICFKKWISDNQDNQNVKADFVTFQGRMMRSLKTPLNLAHGEWTTHGANLDGMIYLWDEKTARPQPIVDTFHQKLRNDNNFRGGQFAGNLFEKLVTGEKHDFVDEVDKVFLIQKATLGNHSALVLSSIDAQDPVTNDLVQVTLRRKDDEVGNRIDVDSTSFLKERDLKIWSQAEVSGSKKIVLGERSHTYRPPPHPRPHLISSIKVLTTEELRSKVGDETTSWEHCFHFQNRLFDWIKSHLAKCNPNLVKRFSYIPGDRVVYCTTVANSKYEAGKFLVPSIYGKRDQ